MPKFKKSNNYTMKMGSRQIDGDTTFRMDSYAMQYNYAMKNDPNGKDSKSGSPYPDGDVTKVDFNKTTKLLRDEVALDQASRSGKVYRRYNVPQNLANDLGKPKMAGMRVTEEVLAANINNMPRSKRNKYKGWFQNAQRERFQYFRKNHPKAFQQMLKGKKYKID